jgi:hypothetical protein
MFNWRGVAGHHDVCGVWPALRPPGSQLELHQGNTILFRVLTSYLDHVCEKITFLAWDFDHFLENFNTSFQQFPHLDMQLTVAASTGMEVLIAPLPGLVIGM